MRVWRIATDTPHYGADDLTGKGAQITGGRWNREGLPVLYCADTPALACLETVIRLNTGDLPLNRYLVSIEIPEGVWDKRQELPLDMLPVGWDAVPAGLVSLNLGSSWLQAQVSPVLVLPSAIVPECHVVLINPQHPQAVGVTATKTRKWHYDPRIKT